MVAYSEGEPVEVFYRSSAAAARWEGIEWHASTEPLMLQPLISAGWLPAVVAADWVPPSGGERKGSATRKRRHGGVRVRFEGQLRWFDLGGEEWGQPVDDEVDPGLVRRRASLLAWPRPAVSFLAVRWGGGLEKDGVGEVATTTENWGPTNSSVSDSYINAFFDQVQMVRSPLINRAHPTSAPLTNDAPAPSAPQSLGPTFEVHSSFVSTRSDLDRLDGQDVRVPH